uniref:uncharacterized protein n=1 Tax=Myxine glutinosa TaxID=7769 RepID=UPI00358FAB4B
MSYYSILYSDKEEEYSPSNANILAELQTGWNENTAESQELQNEMNLNNLPISPFLEDSYASLEDQSLEWDDFDFPKSGYFPSTCGTLNFQLDHLNTKLDFLEKEIPNLKISAAVETTFVLCWEEIDDLCWEEVECIIPQGKCFCNMKLLFKILFIYICFVQNYLIINYKKRIKVRRKGVRSPTLVTPKPSDTFVLWWKTSNRKTFLIHMSCCGGKLAQGATRTRPRRRRGEQCRALGSFQDHTAP